MVHLFVLFVVNSLAVFALFVLLVRSIWSLGSNTTTIESWEIERHNTLLRRARHFGGYLEASGGLKVRIKKQEFPYDIGIWDNIKAGMGGSSNVRYVHFMGYMSCAHGYRSSVGFGHLQRHPIVALDWSLRSMILKVGPVCLLRYLMY